MTFWFRDLRFALRSLSRRPAFVTTVVATLALGIGANVTMMSFARSAFFRSVPHVDEEGLLTLSMRHRQVDVEAYDFSVRALDTLTEDCSSCGLVAAFDPRTFVVGGETTEQIRAAAVTANFLRSLGLEPQLGRHLDESETVQGGPRVAQISHRFWQERFRGATDVLGQILELDGSPFEIVGILPAGFAVPPGVDLWIPFVPPTDLPQDLRFIDHLLVRTAPGTPLETVRAELDALGRNLAMEYPESNRNWTFDAEPFRTSLVDVGERHALRIVFGSVLLVLLVACANVALLLLVRESERRHETAVLLALGTSRRDLLRRLFTEASLLALTGALAGCLLAAWAVEAIVAAAPGMSPWWAPAEVDGGMLAFALILAGATTLVFGSLPAIRGLPTDLAGTLRAGNRPGASDRSEHTTRKILVVAEAAVTVLLLFGAGLLGQSLRELSRLDPGFDTEGVVVAPVYLGALGDSSERARLLEEARSALEEIPQVVAATGTGAVPLIEDGISGMLLPEGAVDGEDSTIPVTVVGSSSGLFETLGVPLLRGRDFLPEERLSDPWSGLEDGAAPEVARPAIVNSRLALFLWSDGNPLGRRFRFSSTRDGGWYRVVGVAPDLYYQRAGAATDQSGLQVHLPFVTSARSEAAFVVRTHGGGESVRREIADRLTALHPGMPRLEFRPLEDLRDASLGEEAVRSWMVGTLGFFALLVSAVGTYGLLALAAQRRRRELGIRLVLGAAPALLRRLLWLDGARLVALGGSVGLLGALGIARWTRGQLPGLTDAFPVAALGTSVGVLAFAMLLASWLPARRASRLDPAEILRAE